MREIKFRCWNCFSNVMHDWSEMVEKNKIHLISEQRADYPVMQYTGLIDRNGVEIYEGDIVPDDYGEYFGYVKYCDEGARFILACCRSHEEMYALSHLHWDAIEVIGNIHQNPELLN